MVFIEGIDFIVIQAARIFYIVLIVPEPVAARIIFINTILRSNPDSTRFIFINIPNQIIAQTVENFFIFLLTDKGLAGRVKPV